MLGSDSESTTPENIREFLFKDNKVEKWGLRADTDSWEILKVKKGQRGMQLGVQKGWRLNTVAGIKCTDENRSEIEEILKAGEECVIRFEVPEDSDLEDIEMEAFDRFANKPMVEAAGESERPKSTPLFWLVWRGFSVVLNIAFAIYFYWLFFKACPAEETALLQAQPAISTNAAGTAAAFHPTFRPTEAMVAGQTPKPTRRPTKAEPTYKKIGDDCGNMPRWGSVYGRDPQKCIPWILRTASCHQKYFVHSTNGDLRCGCFEKWFKINECHFEPRQWGVKTYELIPAGGS